MLFSIYRYGVPEIERSPSSLQIVLSAKRLTGVKADRINPNKKLLVFIFRVVMFNDCKGINQMPVTIKTSFIYHLHLVYNYITSYKSNRNLSIKSALPSLLWIFLYKRIREAVIADVERITILAISFTGMEILIK